MNHGLKQSIAFPLITGQMSAQDLHQVYQQLVQLQGVIMGIIMIGKFMDKGEEGIITTWDNAL